jgi:hypothetical protein
MVAVHAGHRLVVANQSTRQLVISQTRAGPHVCCFHFFQVDSPAGAAIEFTRRK